MTSQDICGYCGHSRARHNRKEPANPQPGGNRCAKGCVCAFFKEKDGRPAYVALAR